MRIYLAMISKQFRFRLYLGAGRGCGIVTAVLISVTMLYRPSGMKEDTK